MKGIILAGGSGTRLKPLTDMVCKQLLPVYDKPLLYYPLGTLMLMGIRDILIISTPEDTPIIKRAMGDGTHWGIRLSYAVQPAPDGLAQALIIGEDFLDGAPCCLILGDNILHWGNLKNLWKDYTNLQTGAAIVGYPVSDPGRYGVIEMDEKGRVLSIEEKPAQPKSNLAAIGLYFYDGTAPARAKTLRPSKRGELEITDLNLTYLHDGELRATILSRGTTWLDAGTFDSLMSAAQFMQIIEARQGLKICCPEEIAFVRGFIQKQDLLTLAERYGKSPYGAYLKKIAGLKAL